jgi:hypothetical protein
VAFLDRGRRRGGFGLFRALRGFGWHAPDLTFRRRIRYLPRDGWRLFGSLERERWRLFR